MTGESSIPTEDSPAKSTRDVALVEEPDALRLHLIQDRQAGRRIGVVPTMGALHAGHLSLMEKKIKQKKERIMKKK